MVEKLVKVFTRDFALFTCELWRSELIEKFQQALGITYHDAPITSNGRAIAAFYLEKDVEAIKNASIAKFKREPNYYFSKREKFLQDMGESHRVIKKLTKQTAKFDAKTLAAFRKQIGTLFPMVRFSNFLPYFWADEARKELGSSAEKLMATALEDRGKSEGVAELLDSSLRRLISKKLKSIGKPEIFAKFLTDGELGALAEDEELNWNEIAERTGGWVYCKGKIYPTPAYQAIFKQNGYAYEEEKLTGNVLKGTVTFSGGVVKGKAQVLFALEEVAKFQKGNIMITPMTVPDFIPAMRMAKAIVTDEGGVTCHAAIVSRELKIPCVIGTKVATKVFKDGDEVEVDTERGIVRKL